MRSVPSATLALLAAASVASDPAPMFGTPYQAEGRAFTPADAPFDVVGMASADAALRPDMAVAHRTLPIPSYVEVTDLDTGRTILAPVEQRGPSSLSQIVDLSPVAAALLRSRGPATTLILVGVRRVNPQEYERAPLRTGRARPSAR